MDNDFDSSSIYTKPIIKINDKYIILIPGLLISAALHKAPQTAVEWGLIFRNVVDAVSAPHVQCADMQTWNEDDITYFLDVAKDSPYYALFYTALFTGMRRSELLALKWSDLDLLLCQVYVSRSLHVLRGGKVVFRPSKTAKGRRMIALSPSNVSVLRKHQEKQQMEGMLLGKILNNEDLVFSHFDGKPLLPNTVTHALIKLVRRSGLKAIRFHDARHTRKSYAQAGGTSKGCPREARPCEYSNNP